MYKLLFLGIIMFTALFTSAQMDDLIVTNEGDSIACKILEVNDSQIIFQMKYGGRNDVQTTKSREEISEYKYHVIRSDAYIYKPETSFIIGQKFQYTPGTQYPTNSQIYTLENLQNASDEELDYYLYKANKLQKSGKTVTIVGGSILAATAISITTIAIFGTDDWPFVALAVGVVGGISGIGTMAVGIPMKAKGKKRVEQINSIKGTSLNDIRINLQPCAQYNIATQNYQPGVTFKISF